MNGMEAVGLTPPSILCTTSGLFYKHGMLSRKHAGNISASKGLSSGSTALQSSGAWYLPNLPVLMQKAS